MIFRYSDIRKFDKIYAFVVDKTGNILFARPKKPVLRQTSGGFGFSRAAQEEFAKTAAFSPAEKISGFREYRKAAFLYFSSARKKKYPLIFIMDPRLWLSAGPGLAAWPLCAPAGFFQDQDQFCQDRIDRDRHAEPFSLSGDGPVDYRNLRLPPGDYVLKH